MNATKIPIGGRTEVSPNDIMLLQADINYTILFCRDGKKIIVATPLKNLQARFEPFNFYRTHKSYMVNLECVSSYLEPHKQVQMFDNKKIIVSRRKINGLKDLLLNDR